MSGGAQRIALAVVTMAALVLASSAAVGGNSGLTVSTEAPRALSDIPIQASEPPDAEVTILGTSLPLAMAESAATGYPPRYSSTGAEHRRAENKQKQWSDAYLKKTYSDLVDNSAAAEQALEAICEALKNGSAGEISRNSSAMAVTAGAVVSECWAILLSSNCSNP